MYILIAKIIFWVTCTALIYCYFGYGLLLHFFNSFKHKATIHSSPELPQLTLIIPSFDEGHILEKKIKNSLALRYPTEKLKIIIVADGSADDTLSILANYPQVTLLFQPQRRGKAAALNRAMKEVTTPITVFSDANSLLNKDCLEELVTLFVNNKIGGVAGEKRIAVTQNSVGRAEGLYWEYESWIKKREAAFKTVIGAAGELFAMRTELYEPIPEHIILDDFYISLRLCLKGYTINYAANAYATEAPTTSIGEEEKRKVRIAAGAFQVVNTIQWKGLLKQPLIAFQFFSRRWLRWVVCPFALPLILFLNIVLVINESPFLYTLLLVLQVFFYLVALVGAMTINNRKLVPATAFFYFLFMNYCLLKGLLLYLRKKQTVLWPKAARQV